MLQCEKEFHSSRFIDLWDYDQGSAPVIFDMEVNGEKEKLLVPQVKRVGIIYSNLKMAG